MLWHVTWQIGINVFNKCAVSIFSAEETHPIYPENRGNNFLPKVGLYLLNYTSQKTAILIFTAVRT
jgi:hypothetical protein